MKKVIIAGASGMVGSLILEACLADDRITQVVSLVRRTGPIQHPKLSEHVIADFSDYQDHQDLFKEVHAAFFCIGVYTGQVPKDVFKTITVDYAVSFAAAVAQNSPGARLCLLSGAGADRSEKSRTAFARFKGMAENQIAALDVNFHSFRPAYIYPVTPRKEPNLMYRISRALYPLLRLFGSNASIKSTELAQAMFEVGMDGGSQQVYENREMLALLEA